MIMCTVRWLGQKFPSEEFLCVLVGGGVRNTSGRFLLPRLYHWLDCAKVDSAERDDGMVELAQEQLKVCDDAHVTCERETW